MIQIKKDVIAKMIKHAQKDAPIEACGYLTGKDGVICHQYEMTNVDHSIDHFSFDPQEQFTVLRDAREKGFEIYAVYHSHPHSPARPSGEDMTLAYDPHCSYAIISLIGATPQVKFFKICNIAVTQLDLCVIDDNKKENNSDGTKR